MLHTSYGIILKVKNVCLNQKFNNKVVTIGWRRTNCFDFLIIIFHTFKQNFKHGAFVSGLYNNSQSITHVVSSLYSNLLSNFDNNLIQIFVPYFKFGPITIKFKAKLTVLDTWLFFKSVRSIRISKISKISKISLFI